MANFLPPKPEYKGIIKSFSYGEFTVHLVEYLFGISCAQNDKESSIYIFLPFWEKLSPEEKEMILKHEATEIRILKEGYPWAIAHRRAQLEEIRTRAKILRKCGQAHSSVHPNRWFLKWIS